MITGTSNLDVNVSYVAHMAQCAIFFLIYFIQIQNTIYADMLYCYDLLCWCDKITSKDKTS